MDYFFVGLFDYFQKRKKVFYIFFGIIVLAVAGIASQISIEEDISKVFPEDRKVEKLNQVLEGSNFLEKMVFTISLKDSLANPDPDALIEFTDFLVTSIQDSLPEYYSSLRYRVDDESAMNIFSNLLDNLPLFLSDGDYEKLDSLTSKESISRSVQNDYRQLISPSGVVRRELILKDPLGFSSPIFSRLSALQYDDTYTIYDNYIITSDHKNVIFFLTTKYPPNDTGHNLELIEGLDKLIQKARGIYPKVEASYFGSPAVSVGNALQLRKDTALTISIMIVMLIIFLVGFFRRKRVPIAVLFPVIFGAAFSLALITLIKGSVSVIAIAAGSIVMGIAVNYSLHYFVHLRHTHDIRETIRDLAKPMTVGSTTTVLAFLGLQFVNASLLRDVGLFAGFSLIGAMLFSLIFLPHLFRSEVFNKKQGVVEKAITGITLSSKRGSNILVIIIFALTPVFLYYAGEVRFNSDMNKLNFMTDDLKESQRKLNSLNQFAFRSVFLVSEGSNMESALQRNEEVYPLLKNLESKGLVKKISTVSDFLLSDSLQQVRINRWNTYWTSEKKKEVINTLREETSKLGFKPNAFQQAINIIENEPEKLSEATRNEIRSVFFQDNFSEKENSVSVISFIQVNQEEKNLLYEALADMSQVVAVDNEVLTTMLVEYVNEDFNFILTFTSLLVFFALLSSYGRIELTLITFVPMLITWIWILGIMALLKIEFNIVNVMISTFIFGLGDDYSIFIMDGLQQKYRNDKNNLTSIRTSVILSALTTISGLGVLIFAEHPALKSIALISIVGIVCVVIMSQTVEPFLFRFFISSRTRKGFPPMTFWGFLKTLFAFGYYVFGALLLTIIGSIIYYIPIFKKQLKYFYHILIRLATGSLVYLMANVRKKIIWNDHDFSKPSIIIANHSSFIDILATAMLHPKLILLTNKWVWNSPVFGRVVRFADYYPVMQGAEDGIDQLSAKLNEGYSVIIFPEGTRSYDGKLRRFHKGAFYLAEHLQIPITPLVIHGMNTTIQKGDFYLQDGSFTMKFLEPVLPDDKSFGEGYRDRAKQISKRFKAEFQSMREEYETPAFFRKKLISNYLFKGPVLEWYLKVKLRLEKDYEPFINLIPKEASIVDLGCGYGFLCYMLQFTSEDRSIIGVDYDEDKIETAQNGYLKSEKLNFVAADVVDYQIPNSDIIILSDVLHYLAPEQQERVMEKSSFALNPGGMIILREGITDTGDRYKGTKLSEFFSVKVMKFNKSTQPLSFMTGEKIRSEASKHNLEIEVIDDAKFTSNVIFVLRKNK